MIRIIEEHWKSLGVFVLFCVVSLIWWWPTRLLPYHWDSAGFVINGTRELVEHNYIPWIVEHSDFAHPPLLMTWLGFMWQGWENDILGSHVLMYPFLPILMMATYLLVKQTNVDEDESWVGELVAIGGGTLAGSLPFVLAEYGMIYIDLPAGALAAMGVAMALRRRYLWGGVFLTLGVLTKESVLLLIPPLVIAAMKKEELLSKKLWMSGDWKKKKYVSKLKALSWILVPALLWVLWVMYHQSVTGWALIRPGRETLNTKSLESFSSSAMYVLSTLLFADGRWVLSSAATGGLLGILVDKRRREQLLHTPLLFLWMALAFGVIGYGYIGEFTLRYAIFLLPIWVSLGIALARSLVGVLEVDVKYRAWSVLGLLLLTIYISMNNWRNYDGLSEVYDFRPPVNLEYMDHIKLGQEMADYLVVNYSDAVIYGGFPENYQLTQPWQGFVYEPLDFKPCEEFVFEEGRTMVMVRHPYSPSQLACQQIEAAYVTEGLPKYQFVVGDMWLELYEIVGPKAGPDILDPNSLVE